MTYPEYQPSKGRSAADMLRLCLRSLCLVVGAVMIGVSFGAGIVVVTNGVDHEPAFMSVVPEPFPKATLSDTSEVQAPVTAVEPQQPADFVPEPIYEFDPVDIPADPEEADVPEASLIELRPKIAIVIDDMGWDANVTENVAALPAPLTLSFLPTPTDLESQIEKVRMAGHEVWAHIPMEPLGDADPGPGALKVGMTKPQILTRFRHALAVIGPVSGFNNHMGSRFTADPKVMTWVLDEAVQRDLAFIDSETSPKTVAFTLANTMSLKASRRDVFLDHAGHPSEAEIEGQFKLLERIALKNGSAIAIGHPYDSTMAVLARWLDNLDYTRFEVVTAREAIEHQLRQTTPEADSSPLVAAVE